MIVPIIPSTPPFRASVAFSPCLVALLSMPLPSAILLFSPLSPWYRCLSQFIPPPLETVAFLSIHQPLLTPSSAILNQTHPSSTPTILRPLFFSRHFLYSILPSLLSIASQSFLECLNFLRLSCSMLPLSSLCFRRRNKRFSLSNSNLSPSICVFTTLNP